MNVLALISILDALLALTARLPVLSARFRAIRDEVAQMQVEGRDPTPEEWEALGAKIDDRLARLKAQVGA